MRSVRSLVWLGPVAVLLLSMVPQCAAGDVHDWLFFEAPARLCECIRCRVPRCFGKDPCSYRPTTVCSPDVPLAKEVHRSYDCGRCADGCWQHAAAEYSPAAPTADWTSTAPAAMYPPGNWLGPRPYQPAGH